MPALDYITIQGFKSVASIEKLELRPVNVVIGANGSGKSNFLGAFAFLRAIGDGRLREYVTKTGGAEKVLHFGSKVTGQIALSVSFGPGTVPVKSYELTLNSGDDDGLFPSREFIIQYGSSVDFLDPRQKGREAGISDPER
jgi:predicted ATPase